jgi:hypothetical protein
MIGMLATDMAKSISIDVEGSFHHFRDEFKKSGPEWSLVSRYRLPNETITYSKAGDGISSAPRGSTLLARHIAVLELRFTDCWAHCIKLDLGSRLLERQDRFES